MQDIGSVMWKERRLLFRHRGSRKKALLPLATPIGLTAYMTSQEGTGWFGGPFPILTTVISAAILTALIIPDSIAGERERRTLSTLLASRLPDKAILFGKLAVGIGVAWAAAILVLIFGFILVNVVHWSDAPMWYDPKILYSAIAFSFLISALIAILGVFFSMRAATVQDAAGMIMMLFMTPPLILGVLVTSLLARNRDPGETPIKDFIESLGSPVGLIAITAGLILLNLALLRWAISKFARPYLTGR